MILLIARACIEVKVINLSKEIKIRSTLFLNFHVSKHMTNQNQETNSSITTLKSYDISIMSSDSIPLQLKK